MPLRLALLLLVTGLAAGCVSSGHESPLQTGKGREEARVAYVQLGLGYLQQGMSEQAKVPLKRPWRWTATMPTSTRHWPWYSRPRPSLNWPISISERLWPPVLPTLGC